MALSVHICTYVLHPQLFSADSPASMKEDTTSGACPSWGYSSSALRWINSVIVILQGNSWAQALLVRQQVKGTRKTSWILTDQQNGRSLKHCYHSTMCYQPLWCCAVHNRNSLQSCEHYYEPSVFLQSDGHRPHLASKKAAEGAQQELLLP